MNFTFGIFIMIGFYFGHFHKKINGRWFMFYAFLVGYVCFVIFILFMFINGPRSMKKELITTGAQFSIPKENLVYVYNTYLCFKLFFEGSVFLWIIGLIG